MHSFLCEATINKKKSILGWIVSVLSVDFYTHTNITTRIAESGRVRDREMIVVSEG